MRKLASILFLTLLFCCGAGVSGEGDSPWCVFSMSLCGVCVESRFRVAVPRLQIKFKGPELRLRIDPAWTRRF